MFGSVGIALGALSTVSSLLEAAAGGIEKAKAGGPSVASQQFSLTAPPPSTAKPVTPSPGAVLPKYDKHTQAALLALQEQQNAA